MRCQRGKFGKPPSTCLRLTSSTILRSSGYPGFFLNRSLSVCVRFPLLTLKTSVLPGLASEFAEPSAVRAANRRLPCLRTANVDAVIRSCRDDSLARVRRIVNTLTNTVGRAGFHFIIPGGGGQDS